MVSLRSSLSRIPKPSGRETRIVEHVEEQGTGNRE
jgi:hypothetical protein